MREPAALSAFMHAWAYYRYGGPEVLERVELPMPLHGDKDVLIRVHATTVNRTDCGL
ncbi:MAG: hypothetical protein WBB32_08825 [Flavobacteriales bacterium]